MRGVASGNAARRRRAPRARGARVAHGHRDVQLRSLALQPVADQPVERGQRRGAAGMRRERDRRRLARGPAAASAATASDLLAVAQARVDAAVIPSWMTRTGAPCGPTARNTRWEMPRGRRRCRPSRPRAPRTPGERAPSAHPAATAVLSHGAAS